MDNPDPQNLRELAGLHLPVLLEMLENPQLSLGELDLEQPYRPYLVGMTYRKMGRFEDAIAVLEHIAARGADTKGTYQELELIYRKLGRINNAIRSIDLMFRNCESYLTEREKEIYAKRMEKLKKS